MDDLLVKLLVVRDGKLEEVPIAHHILGHGDDLVKNQKQLISAYRLRKIEPLVVLQQLVLCEGHFLVLLHIAQMLNFLVD